MKTKKLKIILASASPRRKELLEREGISFTIDASSIDEVLNPHLPIKARLEALAIEKGASIHDRHPDDVVISADTTVYHNGEIIGKPKDEEDAKNILMSLSNDTHIVYTAVSIWIANQKHFSWVEETFVTFKDITKMIPEYLESGEWQGKAGAYGIQGKADIFVEKVEGDIDSVIGLPVTKIVSFLKEEDVID